MLACIGWIAYYEDSILHCFVVTRVLNRRAVPPRKAARVDKKIERWADDYAEKRVVELCAQWLRPGGHADTPDASRALTNSLRALRLDRLVPVTPGEGTTTVPTSF